MLPPKNKIIEIENLTIAHIIPELNLKIMGGISRFLQTLLLSIDKKQLANIIITFKSDPEERYYYQQQDIKVFSLLENTQQPETDAIQTTRWLMQVLRECSPDIVTTHGFWADVLGVPAARRAEIPVITRIEHSMDTLETAQQVQAKQHLSRLLDHTICISNSVQKYIQQTYQVPEHLLTTIYYGIILENHIYPQSLTSLPSLNQFVFVGRLEPQKFPQKLIQAFSTLCQQDDDCALTMIGDGSLRGECEELVRHLDISARTQFLGYQAQPWEQVATGSIFVMTSIHEGLPYAILEAMASGCLCILPNLEQLLEIGRDGKEAIFYEAGNLEHLVAKMKLAIAMPLQERLSILTAARSKTEKNFSAISMAEQYADLYRELYAQKMFT